ncbi:MAG: PIN domain-containing protein [Elusimicrobiota bacterium]
MFTYIARLVVIIAGPVIGYIKISPDGKGILIGTGAALIVIAAEIIIQKVRLDDLVAGGLGIVIGLIAASLINNVVPVLIDNVRVSELFEKYTLLISVVLSYIFMILALNKKNELDLLDREINITGAKLSAGLKIIDSSAIIDARILDIADTGYLEGVLVIPSFIMGEVQATADSPDEEKRKKARRALEIVNNLRENENVIVKMYDKDYPEIEKNDIKLIKICQELKAKMITCDYNLTKSASAQGIGVLNVNELANALKPKLLPGEAIEIFVIKKGRDKEQGVGFLEDGTMVVIDEGKNYIGKKVEITVTSVLQKSSGRMIFAKVS